MRTLRYISAGAKLSHLQQFGVEPQRQVASYHSKNCSSVIGSGDRAGKLVEHVRLGSWWWEVAPPIRRRLPGTRLNDLRKNLLMLPWFAPTPVEQSDGSSNSS
jgi:hypothetical protein